MHFKKQGYPEVGEIVLCTVKKILHHSVFVSLDEFVKREGLIHIAEVSPGRIRNLRDYVREGKVIVCKVLRVNSQKGHIDLSLRRVNLSQRKLKLEEISQEKRAEKLLEVFAKQTKRDPDKLILEVGTKIKRDFDSIFESFTEVAEGGSQPLINVGIESKLAQELTKMIQEKIKKVSVTVSRNYNISCQAPNGMTIIQKALTDAQKSFPTAKISYVGAPKYRVILEDADYKDAETKLNKLTKIIQTQIEKEKGLFESIKNG